MLLTRRAVLLSGIAAGTVAACGRQQARVAPVRTKVTALTGYGMLGQDAYLHSAADRGAFTRAGLDVQVHPGAGTADNLTQLAAGKVDFATVDMSGALQAYGNGRRDWMVVAVVYQRTVSCLITRANAGITSARDLAGKRIGYTPGGVNYTLFPAYAKVAGIDTGTIRWMPVAPASLRTLLATGKADAVTETVIGKVGVEAATGWPVFVLPYSDVMSDLYGNVVVTSTKRAQQDPGLVRRYRDAVIEGLRYAIDHPDDTGAAMHRRVPSYPAKVAAEETNLMAPFVRPISGDQIGVVNPSRLAKNIALLKGVGAMKGHVDPEQIMFDQG